MQPVGGHVAVVVVGKRLARIDLPQAVAPIKVLVIAGTQAACFVTPLQAHDVAVQVVGKVSST